MSQLNNYTCNVKGRFFLDTHEVCLLGIRTQLNHDYRFRFINLTEWSQSVRGQPGTGHFVIKEYNMIVCL